MTGAVALPTQFTNPRLLPLPRAGSRASFLVSLILHAASIPLLLWLPTFFPTRADRVVTAEDLIHDPNYHLEMLPVLPRMTSPGSWSTARFHQARAVQRMTETAHTIGQASSSQPKPDYASPLQIVSELPDATNEVQTIRRPDLAAPPKLKFPMRLPSLVMLPAPPKHLPAAAPQAAPQVVQTAPSLPELAMTAKPSVAVPALPISIPTGRSLAVAEQAPPSIAASLSDSSPGFAHTSPALTADMVASTPKAVVVLNAVGVPPEMAPPIPDAELSGHFVVGSSKGLGAPEAPLTPVLEESTRVRVSNGGASSSRVSVTGGSGRSVDEPTGVDPSAPQSGSVAVPGPGGQGADKAAAGGGAGSSSIGTSGAGLPGISVSGGASDRSGRAIARGSFPHNPYGLTIVSGGSSGGVTRDLGVFRRNETVYTVYIPMADVGGPDCPMEYALVGSTPAGNGLLTPPVAIKKVQATAPNADPITNSAPVFIAAVIDEAGTLRDLKPIPGADGRSQPAVRALSQWVFRPAQLNGIPVASKVLIGITVFPVAAPPK